VTLAAKSILRLVAFAALICASNCLHAQYERIQMRVYGLDCELCARGVAASIMRLGGVKSVAVNLKQGLLDIALKPDNNFKMSSLRKRIQDNGFRSMEATVTAFGKFDGSRFEVLGSGEWFEVKAQDSKSPPPIELTFQTRESSLRAVP